MQHAALTTQPVADTAKEPPRPAEVLASAADEQQIPLTIQVDRTDCGVPRSHEPQRLIPGLDGLSTARAPAETIHTSIEQDATVDVTTADSNGQYQESRNGRHTPVGDITPRGNDRHGSGGDRTPSSHQQGAIGRQTPGPSVKRTFDKRVHKKAAKSLPQSAAHKPKPTDRSSRAPSLSFEQLGYMLHRKHKTTQERLAEYSQALNDATKELALHSRENNDLTQQCQDLTHNLVSLQTKYDKDVSSVIDLSDQWHEEKESLEKRLVAIQKHCNSLSNHVEALQIQRPLTNKTIKDQKWIVARLQINTHFRLNKYKNVLEKIKPRCEKSLNDFKDLFRLYKNVQQQLNTKSEELVVERDNRISTEERLGKAIENNTQLSSTLKSLAGKIDQLVKNDAKGRAECQGQQQNSCNDINDTLSYLREQVSSLPNQDFIQGHQETLQTKVDGMVKHMEVK